MLNPELLQRGLATLNAIDGAQGEAVMTGAIYPPADATGLHVAAADDATVTIYPIL